MADGGQATLKAPRNPYEDRVLLRLAEVLPAAVKVRIVADRGFGDQKLYRLLTALGFDYVIRFRGNIQVTDAHGQTRAAAQWVGHGGRARTLRGAAVTADRSRIGTVVCVPAKGMKEPGCLATHSPTATARILINYYAKRWGLETGFRDTQDLRFGPGLGWVRISRPDRRDRLWLRNALAVALLPLLGASGEALGYDRHLQATTVKTRTHPLFRQGGRLFEFIATMPAARLTPLMQRFGERLLEQRLFSQMFSVVCNEGMAKILA